jgi:adsorption protein B
VANLLSSADQVTVRSVLGHDPIQHIAREGEIMAGLRLISGTTTSFVPGVSHAPLLGDLLIERGLVRRNDFDGLMAQYQPALHGRIGDFLTQSGVISRAALEEAIATQRLAGSQGTSTPTSESAFITPSVLGANA